MNQLDFKTSDLYKSSIDSRGTLFAFNEIKEFLARRVFFISCNKGHWRGKHYHKKTTQMVLVLSGQLEVKITSQKGEILQGLMVPGSSYLHVPNTQFEFCALSEDAQLLVLCDTLHDPEDYYVISNE